MNNGSAVGQIRRATAVLGFGLSLLSVTAAATSLYTPDQYQALATDTRSFRTCDALTVLIVETSTAESRAVSTASRETNVTGSLQDATKTINGGLDARRNSTGSGNTTRAGKLQAQISVRVQDVAANGDLAVYGSQKITINGETQTIAVSGVVRPIDVSSDNIVLSTRLSNADIVYNGRGFVDRNQQESWISRLLGLFGL